MSGRVQLRSEQARLGGTCQKPPDLRLPRHSSSVPVVCPVKKTEAECAQAPECTWSAGGCERKPPAPDLVIDRITGIPSFSKSASGSFDATVHYKNVGTADAVLPAGSEVIRPLGQAGSRTQGAHTIAPNMNYSRVVRLGFYCIRSSQSIVLEIDPSTRIAESDESNNRAVGTIKRKPLVPEVPSVPTLRAPQPDLLVKSVVLSPDNPDYRSTIALKVVIENAGNAEAIFCMGADGNQSSGDSQWTAVVEDAPASSPYAQRAPAARLGERILYPKSSWTDTLPIVPPKGLPDGCYRVRVDVDPKNAIAESNEANNAATAYLSLGGASCDLLRASSKPQAPTGRVAAPSAPENSTAAQPTAPASGPASGATVPTARPAPRPVGGTLKPATPAVPSLAR
jgi:hypothetical protein